MRTVGWLVPGSRMGGFGIGVFLAAGFAGGQDPGGGPVPEPGFEVRPWCSPGRVREPRALAWDPRGRPWVLDGSELVRITDTDRDGTLDQAEPFAADLEPATAFLFLGEGRVLLAQERGLVLLADEDGDGRADRREPWGTLPAGVRVAALERGIDGNLYLALGGAQALRAGEAFPADPGIVLLDPAHPEAPPVGVVALPGPPRTLALGWGGEVFFHTSNGALACSVERVETVRAAGAADSAAWTVLHPPDTDRLQGALVYEGGRWPEAFEGNLLVCRPADGVVQRCPLRRAGVTFEAPEAPVPFLRAGESPFRPTSLASGPDGTLVVVDVPTGGPAVLWRVDFRRAAPPPAFRGETRAIEERLEQLASPVRWRRETACQRIAASASADQLELLIAFARRALGPAPRIASVWTLARAAPRRLPDLAPYLLADYRPTVRIAVFEALSRHPDVARRLRPQVEEGLNDPNPRVRLAALRALTGVGSRRLTRVLLDLYAHAADPWTRLAIQALGLRDPERCLGLAIAANDRRLLPFVDALVRTVARTGDASGAVQVLEAANEGRLSAPGIAAHALELLARELPLEVRPWASTRIRSNLRRLLRSEDARLAYASLVWGVRWDPAREFREDLAVLVNRAATRLRHPGTPAEERGAAARALTRLAEMPPDLLEPLKLRPNWTGALVGALEEGLVDPAELGGSARRLLRSVEDGQLLERALRIVPAPGEGG